MKKRTQGFFVTGTDTDIGKTFVSGLVVNSLTKMGTVSYMKPVQTGCTYQSNGNYAIPDFDYIKKNTECFLTSNIDDHVPYRFEPACSPHLAADLDNTTILFDKIKLAYDKIAQHVDYMIVDGTGGIFVPLNDSMYTIELIKFLNIPVLVVTSANVGTLNHTFLTIRALENAQIEISGMILNNNNNELQDYIYQDNRRMIKNFEPHVPFLEITYGAKNHEAIDTFCREIRSI